MKVPELTEPVPQPVISPGKILSERRTEWGLSIQDVAGNLNLGSDTIEAIEADNYDALPGTTFVKGYIRSYARLMNLDAADLIENIDLQPERITEVPSSRASLRLKGRTRSREKRKQRRGIFRWILLLIILGLLVAFGLTQLPRFGINQLSDLFPMESTGLEQQGSGQEQPLIPQNNNQTDSQGQTKGALIRIE